MKPKYRCSMAEDYSLACKSCHHARRHTWIMGVGKHGSCSSTYCWVKGIECRCDQLEQDALKENSYEC